MNRKYRHAIIAGNWKMNVLSSEVKAYADEIKPLIPNFNRWCDVVVCVPFTSIAAALRAFKGSHVSVGAQNMSQYESGAYTGEVSGAQLKDIGTGYVIVGHSERRELFGETDIVVSKKVLAALGASLRPILCVGENLTQREIGVTNDLVAMQVKAALYGVPASKIRRVVIAYEPVWAIGTGKTASPRDAQEVCREIRAVIRGLYGARTARAVSIIYGGSMNEKNAFELLSQPDIDGGLVGGASLKPASFAEIIVAANQP